MEDEEFRALLAQLDDRYRVPGRTVINHEMDKLLIELKGKITLKLQDARKISMCADVWSKKGMTASYLGLSAHFFTKSDHRRHTVTLAVRRLPSPHTAERIEELVREIIKEWEIPESKISAIITDNGSNMIKAFRDWLQEIQSDEDEEEKEEMLIDPLTGSPEGSGTSSGEETEEESDNYSEPSCDKVQKEIEDFEMQEMEHEIAFSLHKRLSCFSHTLQLVVSKFDTLASPKRCLQSASRLVKKFAKSVSATEKLISLAGKKLTSACPTRWNSTYLMISRLLEVRSYVTDVLQQMEWDNMPNSEWKTLESLRDLLEPFARYTDLTSAEEFTTLSMVIPVLMELQFHLDQVSKLGLLCQ